MTDSRRHLKTDDSGDLADVLPADVRSFAHEVNDARCAAQDVGRFILDLGPVTQDFARLVTTSGVVAKEAKLAVREAAGECAPGEKTKTILARAADELGLLHEEGGLRRVRAAWEGAAGSWAASTFLHFMYRRDVMRTRRRQKAREELAALLLVHEAIERRAETTNAAHSEFDLIDPDRLRRLLAAAGDIGRPVQAADAR